MKEKFYKLINTIKNESSNEHHYFALGKLLDEYPKLIPEMIKVFDKEGNGFKDAFVHLICQRVYFQRGIDYLKNLHDQPYTDEEIEEVMADADRSKIF